MKTAEEWVNEREWASEEGRLRVVEMVKLIQSDARKDLEQERDELKREVEELKRDVLELRLCEQEFIILQPDRLYRFTVDESCADCKRLAADGGRLEEK